GDVPLRKAEYGVLSLPTMIGEDPCIYSIYTVFLSGIQEGLIDATTQRFVQELSKVNWNWTMKQPNEWIE
ncbi:hypothetical protein L2W89_21745, partial [Citrobacter freundii]|nr:hypothetical protein [Citrobacter freundii]